MKRSQLIGLIILTSILGLILFGLKDAWQNPGKQPHSLDKIQDSAHAKSATSSPRILPGVQPDGQILLPNQWSLRPVGQHLPLGDFPVNLAIHPSEKYLATLHAGYGQHELVIVDISGKKQQITSRVHLPQTFYGLCFSPDGSRLYASGAEYEVVHSYRFDGGLLADHKTIRIAEEMEKFIPGGIAVDGNHQFLFAAGTWGHGVAVVPLAEPEKRRKIDLPSESYPYACLPVMQTNRLYVSLWGKSAIAVIDLLNNKLLETWPTESHPTEMVLSPNGKTLFVSCSNSTRVSVLDMEQGGKAIETIDCALYPSLPAGNTPNSLSITPDGSILFVANADNNNIAVLNVADPGKAKSLGFIPVGWYPTSVRYHPGQKKLYVTCGKGLGSKANPNGPSPYSKNNLPGVYGYIGGLLQGSLSGIDMPNPEQLLQYTQQAYKCSPLQWNEKRQGDWDKDSPIPGRIGDPSPIKYCIYIIKENRTYDQVFGDIKKGNGDPDLCIFGEKITPNHHKLAQEFVLFDNFYVEGEVSADGHQWTMGAYATDFVEKLWPLNYRGSNLGKLKEYPSEGNYGAIERPAGGYLWDRCAEAGISYRSYGEWIENGPKPGDPGKALAKTLEGHFDPLFRGYDLDYPDVRRAERFLQELKEFERQGALPRCSILRLPNDHTSGTRKGKPTPTAYLADNDLALGMLVEGVSKSPFWKETAIFVIEDDAQNGPDHVDAHRSVALVISPYTRRAMVDSTPYTTSSMLRTMELILGLKPMSQYDASAMPMYRAFQSTPVLKSYEHLVPDIDRQALNEATAWGAKLSEQMDFSREDAADDLLLNEVIWRSVKGANVKMPPPVRAAYWIPKLK